MEDPESCYHPLNIPRTGFSMCMVSSPNDDALLKKRSFYELNQLAIHNLCLSYIQAYKKQKPRRITPPVPKFEETSKKVKILEGPPQNMLAKAQIEHSSLCQIPMPKENSQFHPQTTTHHPQINITLNTQAQSPFRSVFSHSPSSENKLIQQNQPNYLPVFPTPCQTPEITKTSTSLKPQQQYQTQTHQDFKPQDKETITDEMYAKTTGIRNLANNAKLDKKDSKKLEKFIELLHEYMKKLNLSNALIEQKYVELSSIAIPKLSTNFKSKPFEAVAAAILLYACREVQHPITIKQIASASDCKDKVINKCIFSMKELIPTESAQFGSEKFIHVLSEKLILADNVRFAALEIDKNIANLNFVKSIHAVTLAACCVKFASALSHCDKSFDEIAVAVGITKMTLKNMYRDLFPYRFHFVKDNCKLARGPEDLKNI